MSYSHPYYSDVSGTSSVASSNSAYGTWGQLSVSCYTSGSTLYYTLTAHTSDYPYLRAVFWVGGIGNVYDSGYVKNNSKLFPRGNGTTYSSSVNLGSSTSNPQIAVGIGVSTSSITWGPTVTLTRTVTNYAYWDINVYNPEGVQDYKSAYFDEYIGNTKVASQVTNEHASHIYQPYGTSGFVGNINPYYPYYTLKEVWDGDNNVKGEKLSPKSNGLYGSYLNGIEDSIYIYMKYKSSTLTFNLNGGSYNWSSPNRTMTYNSTTSTAPIPTRIGYKFLGWYTTTSGGTKVFNADGTYNSNATSYWGSGGKYLGYNDLTLYANWEIQNVAYVKTENGWKLATIYVKTENGWKPAILYVKTSNGWKQSVV